ncbi:hypothetical protein QJQ45_025707 [Haematococcus lacustris]|nr:hypothetical protein QJQ45_025707 [Haematococcus lacustris]
MDQRITVNIVDASGNSTTLTATPPVNTSSFIKTLVLGHGAGILVKGQNEMVLDETLPAGTYNWRVTAVAQAAEAQAALITHEAHMTAAATQQARVTELLEKVDKQLGLMRFVLPVLMANVKRQLGPPSIASRGSNASFKESLVQFYGMTSEEGKLRCMVLNELLPMEFVCAGHLVACTHKEYAKVMVGFRHFSDPRNGLLWNSAIEEAYELQKICFSFVRACIFRLHVVDKQLMHVKLGDCGKDKTNNVFKTLMGSRAFGELHNTDMDFRNPIGVGPLKSALAFQAMNALSTQHGNYPDTFNKDDHNFDMSDVDGKDELIRAWLNDSSLVPH